MRRIDICRLVTMLLGASCNGEEVIARAIWVVLRGHSFISLHLVDTGRQQERTASDGPSGSADSYTSGADVSTSGRLRYFELMMSGSAGVR